MNKPLSPRLHGYVDFAVVLTFVLAPSLFGFSGTPSAICYALGIAHLGLTLLTDYPMGWARLIPFPVHGGIEAVIAVALLAMPWLFGFAGEEAARNFFLVSGGAVAVTWVLTNYKARDVAPMRGQRTPSYI